MSPEDLSPDVLTNISMIERLCSALSLLGCAFIASTFLTSIAFRKPINRLVFYASFGNIFTNVGTLIARSAIPHQTSFLCQFQGLLIQVFMPADALWAFAMALNVWFTFYYKYDAERIRRLEIFYIVACYGIPFIPGLVYVFVSTPAKGRMYGNAVSWCWVADNWDVFRLATFYAPVWVVIGLTLAIYARAGGDIYANRKRLMNISNEQTTTQRSAMENPFQASKMTEISFVSESMDKNVDVGMYEIAIPSDRIANPSPTTKNPYSVTVTGPNPKLCTDVENTITVNSDNVIDLPPLPSAAHFQTSDSKCPNGTPARTQTDSANWLYAKVAALFFIALMVTWIPSSANRVYSYIHPGQISLGLEFASAFVLPLQGFWNGVIYATTSLPACKSLWREIRGRRVPGRNTLHRVSGTFTTSNPLQRDIPTSRSGIFTEIGSITSSEGRPHTKDSAC